VLYQFELGERVIDPSLILAPMAGITNRAFRLLCREQGAGLVFTEMISDKGLLSGNHRTRELLQHGPDEGPVGVQLFGASPETLAEAAELVADMGFACIDVNMGCPTPKVAERSGAGAALMRDAKLAHDVIRAIVDAVGHRLPVTAKLRSGWDEDSINAVEVAQAVAEAGAAMVTVHGRTRAQAYRGEADWTIIETTKRTLSIPVCGSGDVSGPEEAVAMFEQTGCDGVLFARGALGNPWVFARTMEYIKTGRLPAKPSAGERLDMALRHMDLLICLKGERIAVREMRKHAAWYTRGLYGATAFRNRVNHASTKQEFWALVRNYAQELRGLEEDTQPTGGP